MRRPPRPHVLALALGLALGACDDYTPKVLPHGQAPTTSAPDTATTADTTPAPDTSSTPDAPADTTADAEPAPDTAPTPSDVDPIGVEVGPDHPVIVVPPPPPPPSPTRPRRRMDIDQLDRAITQATGFAWTQTTGGREVNQFQALAPTLGRPDYIETTQEDLSPSTLFQKFLDEAARTVCDRLATHEAALADDDPTPRVLFRHARPTVGYAADPAAIDKNLSHLVLRFHGHKVAPDDPALEAWRWLFRSAEHVSSDARIAWRTVCVGLIVHPAFYTY